MFKPINDVTSNLFYKEFMSEEVKTSLERKQDIMESILDAFFLPSSNENSNRFILNGDVYPHKVYIQCNRIYVMRIANNKETRREKNFNITNEMDNPSCVVIIDNRKNRQIIAIENNTAFNDVNDVANIFQKTLCGYLKVHRLSVDVKAKYHTAEFWEINKKFASTKGIDYVEIPFGYPNLPAVSDLIGGLMRDVALSTNSEPTLKLKGQNNESVLLNENDLWIVNVIKACAASGRPILIKPRGMPLKKIGLEKPVVESLPKTLFRNMNKTRNNDKRYAVIEEFLNNIKLWYD